MRRRKPRSRRRRPKPKESSRARARARKKERERRMRGQQPFVTNHLALEEQFPLAVFLMLRIPLGPGALAVLTDHPVTITMGVPSRCVFSMRKVGHVLERISVHSGTVPIIPDLLQSVSPPVVAMGRLIESHVR